MRAILLLFLALNTFVLAQEREWKPKSFDSLGVESDIDLFEEVDEKETNYSSGYFPIPQSWSFTIGVLSQSSLINNNANGILPTGLTKTNLPYTSEYNSEDSFLDFKEKFSDDDESALTTNNNYNIGLEYKLTPNIGLPIELRASTSISWNTSSLYSEDRSKSYLQYDNTSRSYLEIGNILLEETILEFAGGVNIPLYGAYVSQQVDFSSLYSLYIGANLNEVLSSCTSQYLQIGNVKEKLRYENGLDTTHLVSNIELPTLVKSRLYLEVGLSSSFEVNGYGAKIEVKYIAPTQSILKDESWRQSQFRLAFILYFGGAFW